MADVMVLLNSGGIDSRVAAAMLRAEGVELLSFHVNWGRPARMDEAAEITADLYCADHFTFVFPRDWTVWKERRHKHAPPHTGSTLTALAAGYAVIRGTTVIASGTKREAAAHPDLRIRRLLDGINSDAYGPPVTYEAPLFDMDNDQVTAVARELGVDLSTTWSCPEDPACGVCNGCRRRIAQGID